MKWRKKLRILIKRKIRYKKSPWKTKITGITQFNNQNSCISKCKWYAKHVAKRLCV